MKSKWFPPTCMEAEMAREWDKTLALNEAVWPTVMHIPIPASAVDGPGPAYYRLFPPERFVRMRPRFNLRPSRLKWWLMYWFRRKRFEAIFRDEVQRMQNAMLDNIRQRCTCGEGYTPAQAGEGREGGGE